MTNEMMQTIENFFRDLGLELRESTSRPNMKVFEIDALFASVFSTIY